MKRNQQPLPWGWRLGVTLLLMICGGFFGVWAGLGLSIGTAGRAGSSASAEGGTFMVKDNGYSGNSTQQPVLPVVLNDSLSAAAEEAEKSVVTILTVVTQASPFGVQEGNALGSGVVYKVDQEYVYIISNAHVIEGAEEISLFFDYDHIVKAELQGADREQDLCVIKVKKTDIPEDISKGLVEVEWADSDTVRVGDTCMAIGCPYGLEYANSASVGIVSGTERQLPIDGKTLTVMQTDAAINPGNSGGAMVNTEGKLIGINSAKVQMDSVEGMAFFIPSNIVLPIVKQLMEEGSIQHPSLGIASYDIISEAMAAIYDVPVGLIIYDTGRGTAAAAAGLRNGDIITEIDGQAITSLDDVTKILDAHKIGDQVVLTVCRGRTGSETFTVTLTLVSLEDMESYKGSFFDDRR